MRDFQLRDTKAGLSAEADDATPGKTLDIRDNY